MVKLRTAPIHIDPDHTRSSLLAVGAEEEQIWEAPYCLEELVLRMRIRIGWSSFLVRLCTLSAFSSACCWHSSARTSSYESSRRQVLRLQEALGNQLLIDKALQGVGMWHTEGLVLISERGACSISP